MKKLLILLFSILILPFSVYASDVYYCSDDEGTGFNPKQNYEHSLYSLEKFKVLIDFENEDAVSNFLHLNDIWDKKCFYQTNHGTLYCMNSVGYGFSINKLNLRFIRSSIYNIVNQNDDITLSHGTCEKF